MIKVNIEYVINFLNELTKIDKNAIEKLIECRVLCNEKLAEHESVQVVANMEENAGKSYSVGILGILNGLVGVHDESGWGYIAAVYDDNGKFEKFEQTPKTIKKEE